MKALRFLRRINVSALANWNRNLWTFAAGLMLIIDWLFIDLRLIN